MEDKIKKYFQQDRFAALAGIRLMEAKPGYALAEMEITENHFNAVGVVQGGAIFTLADFAFAAASNSYGFVALAINVNISFYRAGQGKKLTAEAREITANKKLASYQVDIYNDSRELVAGFTGMVYRKQEKNEIGK